MKKFALYLTAGVWLAAIAVSLMPSYWHWSPAFAAEPVVGGYSAKAYTDCNVVADTFVKVSSATTPLSVQTATIGSDKIVGIAESNAATGQALRFAPPGTRSRVGAGAVIAVGDLLTAGPNGYAVPVNTDGNVVQHVAAVALTACADGNGAYHPNVDVLVLAGTGAPIKHGAVELLENNTEPGVPFVLHFDANADKTWIVPAGKKLRVLDCWVVQDGTSGDANAIVTLKNGDTNAITDAINLAHSDHAITRAGSIVDAYQDIAAGTVLTCDVNLVDVVKVRVNVTCVWVTP